MIDGWIDKEKVEKPIFIPDNYEIFDYGDRNINHTLEILLSFSNQFIPTLSQLTAMEKAGLLELEVDEYWDASLSKKVKNESQTLRLILLGRKKNYERHI